MWMEYGSCHEYYWPKDERYHLCTISTRSTYIQCTCIQFKDNTQFIYVNIQTVYIHSIAMATKANYIPQLKYNYNKRHFGLLL